MSRFWPDPVSLFIARRGVSLGAGPTLVAAVPWDNAVTPESRRAAVLACLGACRRRAGKTIHVILSDALVRYWMVSPPANALTLRDLEAAAQWRFESLFADSADAWSLRADWHATRPFLACALPRYLCELVRDSCTQAQVRVARFVPRFVAEWHANRRPHGRLDGWFVVLDDDVATIARIKQRRLIQVQSIAGLASPRPEAATVASVLKCLAVQYPCTPRCDVILAGNAIPPDFNLDGEMFLWRTARRGVAQSVFTAADWAGQGAAP